MFYSIVKLNMLIHKIGNLIKYIAFFNFKAYYYKINEFEIVYLII